MYKQPNPNPPLKKREGTGRAPHLALAFQEALLLAPPLSKGRLGGAPPLNIKNIHI